MMHPIRGWRFARASAAVVLRSALCSVGMAYGALNASVDVSPDTGYGGRDGDARLESRSDIALNPDSAGLVNRGLSQTLDLAKVRDRLAVVDAANTANTAATATNSDTATTAVTATQPIPEPTEYMLLAGGLLILWSALRWKNRARPLGDMPRSRPQKR